MAGGGGGAPGPKNPDMYCVPPNQESCECTMDRDGSTRLCTSTSGGLTCEGTETCNGANGNWEGCTASSPQPEVCDGADNDCNGTADDGPLTDMCGPLPQNVTAWQCTSGACLVDTCAAGWAVYPSNLPPSAGCPCQEEANEAANNSCAGAKTLGPVGSITDANTNAVTMSGRLTSDTDVDWFMFDTVDSDEGSTNSYHVSIRFTSPSSNNEFVFDVIRGDTCGSPDAAHSDLTEYTWCVDGTYTIPGSGEVIGEETCGPTAPRQCGPHSKPYLVRVKRKPGATGSCIEYTLTATAKSAPGMCDFTMACDPQVDQSN